MITRRLHLDHFGTGNSKCSFLKNYVVLANKRYANRIYVEILLWSVDVNCRKLMESLNVTTLIRRLLTWKMKTRQLHLDHFGTKNDNWTTRLRSLRDRKIIMQSFWCSCSVWLINIADKIHHRSSFATSRCRLSLHWWSQKMWRHYLDDFWHRKWKLVNTI